MSKVISVENLSKQYRLGLVNSGTMRDDVLRWWHLIRGKEDPLLKVGESNERTSVGSSDYVWSLREINFDVNEGEVLGVIGRNGAGKSTLLKILSKVTAPTTGVIKAKGRIASLLEVGTGFHPELTGKENIYLNGAILGMRRAEITQKLDEIIDFAGVERYVDTPVKRYSSGMYVRLAFAVAAHLESEILIVDEVLAVGDAEFQKKCLGKMSDVSKSDGKTVLFVSHNMAAVSNLCDRSLVLDKGGLVYNGTTSAAISKYMDSNIKGIDVDLESSISRIGTGKVKFQSFHLENEKGQIVSRVLTGDSLIMVFTLSGHGDSSKVDVGFSLHDSMNDTQTYIYSSYQNRLFTVVKGQQLVVKYKISNFPFNHNRLLVKGRIEVDGVESDWFKDYLGSIEIEKGDFYGSGNKINHGVPFLLSGSWIDN
jgi:lipopolysaccharide transport system ATP-binding protein